MNAQWNTPPDGDFARYVEQLSARSSTARHAAVPDGEHGLDVGMPQPGALQDAAPPGRTAVPQRLAQRLATVAANRWRDWLDDITRKAAENQRRQGK